MNTSANNPNRAAFIALLVVLVSGLLGLCLLSVAGCGCLGALYLLGKDEGTVTPTALVENTSTPFAGGRVPATIEPAETGPAPVGGAYRTYQALQQTAIPMHDPIAFVENVLGKTVAWPTPRRIPPRLGDREEFYIMDFNTHTVYTITAEMVYTTPHAYFWAETGLDFDRADIAALMEDFENHIYPTTRKYFGSEPTPGIDGDPHLYILYVAKLGGGVAGYFSSSDAWPRAVHPYSNQHEMFVFSASSASLRERWTRSLLAHEFQHMIHWNQDRNETSWINEGASELASHLNGYDPNGADVLYLAMPDLQLNTWPDPQQTSTLPHYGASFLFLLYFWERFGDEALRDLIAHDANGWDGVQAVLNQHAGGLSFEQVFLDWLVANTVQEPEAEPGHYGYHTYKPPRTAEAEPLPACTGRWEYQVMPFGMDLYRLDCPGTWEITLEGEDTVPLWPTRPHSGRFAFWSNYGDESEMRLTRRFDLTGVTGPVTLTYWTWYNIEPNYDYVYLLASRDGEHWDMLRPPSATDENPTGNNYGWGYTGLSGAGQRAKWMLEEVDLSDYAGGPVWVRFVYITDAAVNREGFLLDDVRIPEIGYATDFETDDGGWQAEGFVRVGREVPARFRWLLVHHQGERVEVKPLPLDTPHQGTATVTVPRQGDTYLIVTLLTRYTRQPGAYTLSIVEK